MGKPTGFQEYKRVTSSAVEPLERINDYNEFHIPLSAEAQREQAARCMSCGVPFCQSGMIIDDAVSGCPLNNLIPEWNDLIYNDRLEEALDRLLLTNSFPEFTGRVCPAPCEKACTCSLNGDAVSIKENECTIIEHAFENKLMLPKIPSVRTNKRIAVIGSGPSGLAAASQLNKRGHNVTVFERDDRVGGLLMYGIPNMKLEKWVIERRVQLMQAEGIGFVTNGNVGENVKPESLLEEYDAVILACGASNPRDLSAEGRDAKGVYFAVDYLKESTKELLNTNLDYKNANTNDDKALLNAKEKDVVVIGGGDTGNDCVGTAIRQGCRSITQIEMMPKLPDERAENNPWPQWPRVNKTDYGQEEATAVFGEDPRDYETTVKEFIKDESGDLEAIKTVKVEFVTNNDKSRELKEVLGSEKIIPCQICLIAAGFLGSQSYVTEAFGVEIDTRTNVKTEKDGFSTNVKKVFTAGDMRRGQSLVVWAIREGRLVAKEVDKYLMGYTNLR
ncbi:MAG: glutamate synthase subunit beta [Clostridiales bacterium]|nr:glutamate synthase subunit beta [Clostridiales bacterium]